MSYKMSWNKKGQSAVPGLALALIVGIILFLVSMQTLNILIPEVSNAYTNMNCISASTISSGEKFSCLLIDLVIPYSIAIFIGTAGGLVTSKFTS